MILPFDITKTIVWTQMQTAITLMTSVASGQKPMQLICSPSGFGKTSIAKAECRRHGIRFERPEDRVPAMRSSLRGIAPERTCWKLAIETRPKKVISLVRVLYRCSVLNAAFLLFDDPGRLAQDEDACDILKTCFGMQRMVMYETPEITRNELRKQSGHGGYDPFIPPPEFPVPPHLRWLWLSNTNYADPAILAKLGDHFAPLIARGLNPYWVGDDREHDNYALFLYVYHKATEENLLRSMGFPYAVSRQAVNFYITHTNTLIDLCPRRLELIARAFAANVPQEVRDSELESMAPTTGGDRRPKLKLPASWVTAPNGELFWPETPFKRHTTPSPENPNPEPGPDPSPSVATQAVQPEPETDPTPTLRPIPCERGQSPFDAIDEVYRLPIETTCQMVAEVLRQYPLDQWDKDDFDRLAEGLEGRAEWSQCAAIAEPFFLFDTTDSHKLFCTEAEGVLEYRGGRLEISSWESIEQRIAPAVAEAKERDAQRRREQEVHDILIKRLPPQRKLKVMKASIDRLSVLNYTPKTEEGQKAVALVRAMTRDDPVFAECETFSQYLLKAVDE